MFSKKKVKGSEGSCVVIRKMTRKERKKDMARRLEEGRLDENTRLDDARNEGRALGFVQGCAESIEIKKTVSFFRENKFPVDFIQSYLKNIYKKEKPPKKTSKMTKEEKKKNYERIIRREKLDDATKFEIARRQGIGTVRVKTIAFMCKAKFPEDKKKAYLLEMQENTVIGQNDKQE